MDASQAASTVELVDVTEGPITVVGVEIHNKELVAQRLRQSTRSKARHWVTAMGLGAVALYMGFLYLEERQPTRAAARTVLQAERGVPE